MAIKCGHGLKLISLGKKPREGKIRYSYVCEKCNMVLTELWRNEDNGD